VGKKTGVNRSPMLIFSLCLMYNYYMRLVKINRDRILCSAFTTDQDLAQEKLQSIIRNFELELKTFNNILIY
jgi:hypothetical protein